MGLPNIQLYSTSSLINAVWEVTPGYVSYALYSSPTGLAGTFTLVRENIPNIPSLGKRLVSFAFARSSIGYQEANTFYLMLQGVTPLSTVETGEVRIVPSCVGQKVDAGAMNSPITASENKSLKVGTEAIQLELSHDVKFLEVFNNTDEEVLYVEVSGIAATTTRSMPVYPKVYYTVFRNISKDTGISMISSAGTIDARIVVHY
jgi:hypothetical protein